MDKELINELKCKLERFVVVDLLDDEFVEAVFSELESAQATIEALEARLREAEGRVGAGGSDRAWRTGAARPQDRCPMGNLETGTTKARRLPGLGCKESAPGGQIVTAGGGATS